MFCPNCSYNNPAEAKFCAKCGASLQLADSAKGSRDDPKTGGNPVVSEGLKWGILIATIFIPLIGIIAGINYVSDANPDKKSVGKLWLYGGGVMAFIYLLSMA